MKKGLRSRLAQYGDEEFALFLRRGFLKGAGFTDEALDRPIVGILSTASDFNPCHKTAPQVAEAISRGVRMAGALPFVFPTVSLHEAFSFPTSMLLRNLMAMDVEEMIKALPLDAVVLIGGCDKTIPAELMGAISADMPAIIVNVGSMLAGKHEGARLGACTDCRRLWAAYRAGSLDGPNLDRAHDQLMPTSGTCMVMGTASTMACMAETLGFMLPGSATAPAVSSDRWRFAEATGKRAAEMAKTGGPRPSELLTKAALKNASVVLQATSGSTNALVHLAAIAGRAGITYDLAGIGSRRPRGAGAARSEARRNEFHGGLPRRRQPAVAVAAAEGSSRSQRQDRQRRDHRRDHRALAGLRRRQDHPAARQSAGEERSDRDPHRQPRAAAAPRSSSPRRRRSCSSTRDRRWCSIRSRTWKSASTIRI